MKKLRPIDNLVMALREASRVERAHTVPHHGAYTIGQHSFDMLTLLIALKPNCSKQLMLAVIYHDLPERWTGDVPTPIKIEAPEFGEKLREVEEKIADILGMRVPLSAEEQLWLRGLDRVELYLWAQDQVMMGNQHAQTILGSLASWFAHHQMPKALVDYIEGQSWTRTPDTLPKKSD